MSWAFMCGILVGGWSTGMLRRFRAKKCFCGFFGGRIGCQKMVKNAHFDSKWSKTSGFEVISQSFMHRMGRYLMVRPQFGCIWVCWTSQFWAEFPKFGKIGENWGKLENVFFLHNLGQKSICGPRDIQESEKNWSIWLELGPKLGGRKRMLICHLSSRYTTTMLICRLSSRYTTTILLHCSSSESGGPAEGVEIDRRNFTVAAVGAAYLIYTSNEQRKGGFTQRPYHDPNHTQQK